MVSLIGWVWYDLSEMIKEKVEAAERNKPAMRANKNKRSKSGSDGHETNSSDADDSMDIEEETELEFEDDEVEHITDRVDVILDLRNRLVDMLANWMLLNDEDDSIDRSESQAVDEAKQQDSVPNDVRDVQRHAFKMVNDMRMMFSLDMKNCTVPGIDRLAFQPQQRVFRALRAVFDSDSRRLQALVNYAENASMIDDIDEDAAIAERKKQSHVFENILVSLTSSMACDLANVNRRQAAAIIAYFSDSDPRIVDVVKVLGKALKDSDVVKYLEVQMIVIKNLYSDHIAENLQHLAKYEETGESFLQVAEAEGAETEAAEEGDYLRIIETGVKKVESVASRMAQSMGITADQFIKAEGHVGKDAMLSFFNVGMHYALDSAAPYNNMFLDCLQKYTRFLKADQLKELRKTMIILFENDANLVSFMENYEDYQSKRGTDDEIEMDSNEILRAAAISSFTEAIGTKLPGSTKSSRTTKKNAIGSAAEMHRLLSKFGTRVQSEKTRAVSKKLERDSQQERSQPTKKRSRKRSNLVMDDMSSDSESEEDDMIEESEKVSQLNSGTEEVSDSENEHSEIQLKQSSGRSRSGSRPALSLAVENIDSSDSAERSSSSSSSSRESQSEDLYSMSKANTARVSHSGIAPVQGKENISQAPKTVGALPSSRRRR